MAETRRRYLKNLLQYSLKRRNRNKIKSLEIDGVSNNNEHAIINHITNFYARLFNIHRSNVNCSAHWDDSWHVSKLSKEHRQIPKSPFTVTDIVDIVKNASDDKAPGLDGFNATFCKKVWLTIREDVINVVLNSFKNGKLLREADHTFIALIQ